MAEDVKRSVFKTKTFWVNLVMAVLAAVPKVREVVSPEVLSMLWVLLATGLRLVTKDKVILLDK